MVEIAGQSFLIAGGYSLVGSHVADRLLEKGAAEVRLMDNGAVGSSDMVAHLRGNPRVRMIQGDVLRMEDLMAAAQGVAGLFHTAMFITIPLAARPVLGMDVNVRGVINMLEACRWQKVRKVVYSSSIATYGNQTEGPVRETASFNGVGLQPAMALYATAKLMGEALCALYAQNHGLEWVALRMSTVYGDRQHARGVNVVPIVEAYRSARRGEPPRIPGDGTEMHDYVYVGDVARAQVAAMEADVSGEAINVASGRPTSYNQAVQEVLDILGSDLKPAHVDDAGRVKSAHATAKSFDIGKAERLLGWRPEIGLGEGIRRLVRAAEQAG
jgi:UDP-glucose 4-epimerase